MQEVFVALNRIRHQFATTMVRYQVVLLCLTAALSLGVSIAGGPVDTLWATLGLAVVAALAERGRVRLGENIEASISLIPTVFAAAIFVPVPAMVVGAASFVGEFPQFMDKARKAAVRERGAPYLRW